MRTTRQRTQILAALQGAEGAVSAQELFVDLRSAGTPVALATVYRQLQRLADDGAVDRLTRDSGEQAFRVCSGGHHHRLICNTCGRVEEIRDCHLEEWAAIVGREHGFTHVQHAAEFRGVCDTCAQPARR
jgi:Fur family transcriptional regulator, ferric uptake regulator